MGDPTEQHKGSGESDAIHSDADMNSDNEDSEAEVVEQGVTTSSADVEQSSYGQVRRVSRNVSQVGSNSDTVHSILSSISNPNAAVVIPMEGTGEADGEEIDADRMQRFYSGALSAITKMRRQTMKTETKIDVLRNEVGHATMQAWTNEHFDSLPK